MREILFSIIKMVVNKNLQCFIFVVFFVKYQIFFVKIKERRTETPCSHCCSYLQLLSKYIYISSARLNFLDDYRIILGKNRTDNCLLFRYISKHSTLLCCIIGKCTIYGGKGYIEFPTFPISGHE